MTIQKIPGRATNFTMAEDPATGSITAGDCWYNLEDKEFKFKIGTTVVSGAAWTTGGRTIEALDSGDGAAGFGTLLAGVAYGGRKEYGLVSNGQSTYSDEYNGTSWTAGGTMPSPIWDNPSGLGSQTAGLQIGGRDAPGYNTSIVQEYDGTTWTNAASLSPVGHGISASFSGGVQTAGYVAGGNTGTGVNNATSCTAATYEYDGTSWTTGNTMVGGTSVGGGSKSGSTGSQTAGLAVGGNFGGPNGPFTWSDRAEEYDGTNWATGGTLSIARNNAWNSGIQTNAYATGGTTAVTGVTTTESYDGTSWTEVATAWVNPNPSGNAAWSRYAGAGYNGTGAYSGDGFCIVGDGYSGVAVNGYTEEWTSASVPYTADVVHKCAVAFTQYNSGS